METVKNAPNFNVMAQMVEKHFPQYRELVNSSKLFIFDKDVKGVLGQEIPFPDKEVLAEEFQLPFRTVAIEDPLSCILISDAAPNTYGIKEPRLFIESGMIPETQTSPPTPFFRVTNAEIQSYSPNGYSCKSKTSLFYVLVNGKKLTEMGPEAMETKVAKDEITRNLISALEQIMLLNVPSRFVVEMRPGKMKPPKKGRVNRSHQRPQYTLLTVPEIRKIIKYEESEGESGVSGTLKSGHPRKSHTRTLRSEKFKEKRGMKIRIPAVWVGPLEATIGNKVYKVRIDI